MNPDQLNELKTSEITRKRLAKFTADRSAHTTITTPQCGIINLSGKIMMYEN